MIILPKKSGIVLSMFAALNFSLNAYGDERLKLVPGELVTVKIDEDAKSIVGFVANPDIADAYLGLKDTFVFVGKKVGATDFIAVNNDTGQVEYKVQLIVDGVTIYDEKEKKDTPSEYICSKSNCVRLVQNNEETPSETK